MKVKFISFCLAGLLVSSAWSETVQVNDVEMHYEVTGMGPPLLLLHGFGSTGSDSWTSVATELAGDFQVILPDLRGHGRSTNPSQEFTHRQSALDVFGLLDHLGLEQVQAMGISTGGMTLLHMATQQPERLEAMILIGATIYFPEQAREILRNLDPTAVPEDRMEEMRVRHAYGDEQILMLERQFSAFKDSYDDMNFTAPYLSTISARTLIVHGDRDRFFPAHIALEMYEAIPDSYLWLVPNGGHVPIRGPRQDHFLCTATAFLNDEWQSGGPGVQPKLCN